MLTRSRFLNLLVLLGCAAFCVALAKLLLVRFSTGDVFPPYSTLRSDPLGTKIFYDSIGSLPRHRAERNERDLDRLVDGPGTALYVIGLQDALVSEKERIALESFVPSGGRLVITFFPRYQAPHKNASAPIPTPTPSATGEPSPTPPGLRFEKLLLNWDVKLKTDHDKKDDAAQNVSALPLEKTLTWHSGISFHPQNSDWRTIYECDRGPVVIERKFGAGTVVLAADSYFLSNEALLLERAPEFLTWLNAERARAIFDETHLNIHEHPGVATLLRRYGLAGFVLGFVMLILLWLWRNATWSLGLRRSASATHDIVSGRESFDGFVNLLRRGIAPPQLLEVCFTEWKRSAAKSAETKLRPEEFAAIADENSHHPVAAYNRISELLHTRKWKTTSLT